MVLKIIAECLVKWLLGWWIGERKQQQAAQDHQTVQADRQVIHAAEVRHEVEQAIQRIPDAPATCVGDAPADSAAGRLRDQWSRADKP